MNHSAPLVSICIPAYNSEKWIQNTIRSVINQTWEKKEIIVVDDGSTDNTFQLAKQFESENVKVVAQVNSGACAARNKALSIAQGNFIQWLDADDILAENKIETQLEASDKNGDSLILHSAAWGRFYYRLKNASFNPDPLWKDHTPLEWLLIHIGEGYMMHPAAWLVSRRITELAGGWNEDLKLNQDGEYFTRVVASSEYVKFHLDAKCYYRIGNLASISKNRSKNAVKSLSISNNLCIDHLLNYKNDDRTREAAIKFHKRFINRFYLGDKEIINDNKNSIKKLGGTLTPVVATQKFKLFKKIFGQEIARKTKKFLWNCEVILRRFWDKVQALVLNDGV